MSRGDNGFKNEPERKGFTLTTEVLSIVIMTERGVIEKRRKGSREREDDTTVCFPVTVKSRCTTVCVRSCVSNAALI